MGFSLFDEHLVVGDAVIFTDVSTPQDYEASVAGGVAWRLDHFYVSNLGDTERTVEIQLEPGSGGAVTILRLTIPVGTGADPLTPPFDVVKLIDANSDGLVLPPNGTLHMNVTETYTSTDYVAASWLGGSF